MKSKMYTMERAELLTVKEYAELIGKSKNRVYAMGHEGKITIKKMFNTKVVLIDDKAKAFVKQK